MGIPRAKPAIDKIKPHMIGAIDSNPRPVSIALNSNESVYGPSPHAIAAAQAAIIGIERYLENPDTILAPAIAERFSLNANRITIGQGSDDLLARLARAYLGPGTELIRSMNSYLKVPNCAHANDADPISVPDDQFKPSVDRMIGAITERTRIVYVANPENPAGTYLSKSEIRRLHAAIPRNVLLIIDSAYEEYVDAEDYEPAHHLVEEFDNVVMCRTFSKIFGLAGARIGWAYGPDDVIDSLRRIALTFPVSSPSVAAALAALDDQDHVNFVRNANRKGRSWLSNELEKLGLNVIPSQANFILAEFPNSNRSAEDVDTALQQHGIAIRRFASPAFKNYIRITIGRPEDLQECRNVIERFLQGEV
jgi:histidinol-phosphate aminotransferase